MNEISIQDYFRRTGEDGVIFCLRGPMSQETIEMLEEVLKSRVGRTRREAGTTLRVFAVFVEQVQNVIRYSEEREQAPTGDAEWGVGMVMVGRQGDHFFVSCANLIKGEDQSRLEQQLLAIQGMDKEQLRARCKERGRSAPMPGSQGAGLGLVEMARKASDIRFGFSPWNDRLTLFSIQVMI